jgi:pyruvate formate lyase activating enzyme
MPDRTSGPCPELTAAERAYCENVEGIIFDVQRYSLHDGPGLRTNVFFKGCPLRCSWCCNPESQRESIELAVSAANCICCGQFGQPCPAGWRVREDTAWKQEVCAEYGPRADLCPAGGVRWLGERRTAGSVMAEVLRDTPFYEGGGGMTLTGGEPTMQPEFAEALLRLAQAECINTAIETCGHCAWPVLERLLPYLDTILFDIKHMDSETHQAFTGVDNELILDNLRRLAALGAPVTARVALIPGFNASIQSIRAIGEFLAGLDGQITHVDLLPYHTYGRAKYAALAQPYLWQDHEPLTDRQVEELAQTLRNPGLIVIVGG